MKKILIGLLAIALLVGCWDAKPPPTESAIIARLEVTPNALLLEKVGASSKLKVTAFNASNQAILNPQVTFSSSDPSVTVGADGTLLASTLGSSRIEVRAGTVRASTNVIVATPAPGAVLISDAQITGDLKPLDPNASLDVGFRYDITLTGIEPPPVGSLLIGTEAKPIGGRVIAANGNSVTLEMLPLDDMFPGLILNESNIDLQNAPLELNAKMLESFDISRTPSGGFSGSLKAGAALSKPNAAPRVGLQRANGDFEFDLGPISCKAEVSALQISFAKFDFLFEPGLTYDRVWNNTKKRVVLMSNAKASLTVKPVLQSQLEGKLTCELQIGHREIPLPGPIGVVAGFDVPFGVGVEIEAKVPLVAGISWEYKREISATANAGLDCSDVCTKVADFSDTSQPAPALAAPSVNFSLPSLSALKLEASIYAYAFAKLEFGGSQIVKSLGNAVSLRNLEAELIVVKLGVKLEGKFASEETQAKDDTYSSDYRLIFEAGLEPGKSVESFFRFIKVTTLKLELKFIVEIATSPKASLNVTKTEDLKFNLKFDPATLEFPLIGFNVAKVRLYKKGIAANGNATLVLVGQSAMTKGQTQLDFSVVNTEPDKDQTFTAFVETALLEQPRLELSQIKVTAPVPPPVVTVGNFRGTFTATQRGNCIVTTINAGAVKAFISVFTDGFVFGWDPQDDNNGRNDRKIDGRGGITNGILSGSGQLFTIHGFPEERVVFNGTSDGSSLTVNIRSVASNGQICTGIFTGVKL